MLELGIIVKQIPLAEAASVYLEINQRLKEKLKQTTQSDNLNLPALVIIVEFNTPLVKIKKR